MTPESNMFDILVLLGYSLMPPRTLLALLSPPVPPPPLTLKKWLVEFDEFLVECGWLFSVAPGPVLGESCFDRCSC